jgi:hypothetical protein
MLKPDKRPAPDSKSRENAISSRAVEATGYAGVGLSGGVLHMKPVEPGYGDPPIGYRRCPHCRGLCHMDKVIDFSECPHPGAEPVSTAKPQRETQEQETQATGADLHPTTGQITTTQDMGDVPATAVSGDPAEPVEPHTHTRDLSPLAVTNRLRKEGRWNEVEPIRDQMMRECKKRLPDKELRQAWVYSELDRMYPPVQAKPAAVDTGFVGTKGLTEGLSDTYPKLPSSEGSDSGSIQGLEDMPKSWPVAPANASLPSEIAWVQANRLRVVEERPGKATIVRLDLALSPAPSWAALGWLETSIRSYAKFVDVAAKVSGGADDEGAVMRRERKSVDEVKALLREMEEAEGTCERCGRPR